MRVSETSCKESLLTCRHRVDIYGIKNNTSIICRTAVQWKMEIQKLFVSRRERRGVMIRGVSLSNAPICINLLEKILL